MKRMLIAAHARFAEGILSALSLIMGERNDITCINAFVTETPLETQLDNFIASLGEDDQVLVVTDAFFGSVNQKIMERKLKNSLVVTGVNLPLILELVTLLDGEQPILPEQVKHSVVQAREQLMLVEIEGSSEAKDDFDF